MKLAIISDIHYPMEVSRYTYLYTECGYKDSFYNKIKENISLLDPNEIDVFILCGDLYWDLLTLQNVSSWDFNSHIKKIEELRQWLDRKIPLIFIEGNHDIWFNSYIYSEDGIAYISKEHYFNHLMRYFRFNAEQAENIIDNLQIHGDEKGLGKNIHFLKNDGLIIKDTLIYGLPYYDKKNLGMPWSTYKTDLIDKFDTYIEQNTDLEVPIKTIICHHAHPPALKFSNSFNNPKCSIKAFYWGHYHTISQSFIDKVNNNGPYQCVMPEKNNLKVQINEI